MKTQDYFYKEPKFSELATTKDFQNPKRKYFWDGNNGDKWVVKERYGFPVTFVVLENLTQGGVNLYQVEEIEKGFDFFPLNS